MLLINDALHCVNEKSDYVLIINKLNEIIV